MFGDSLPALLPGPTKNVHADEDAGGAENSTTRSQHGLEVETAHQRLARLMRQKEAEDELLRARWEVKRRAATTAVLCLAGLFVTQSIALIVWLPDDALIVACAATGAVGATLGSLMRLRDQLNLVTQVRQFRTFFLGQVLVGAVASIFTLLIAKTGALTLPGGDVGTTAAAFAAGFSEAAFIGLISKFSQPTPGSATLTHGAG